MGTAVMRPVADRAKQSFVLFDTAERQSAQMSKNYKRRLNPVWHRTFRPIVLLYPYGNCGRQRASNLATLVTYSYTNLS